LLAALNPSSDDATTGLTQALGVIAGATKATGVVLYQPAYDSNEWAPSVSRGVESRPVSRATMRDLMGDAAQAVHFHGEAVQPARHQLRMTAAMPQGLVLVPLRAGTKLVGVLGVVPGAQFGTDERAALDQAAPNLAIACERGSAHHNTRRLAVEVRSTAKRLEQLNTDLDAAMKSKDQFLSNISHELRTPLNSIIGFTDLLLAEDLGAPLSAQQHRHALVVTPPPQDLRVQADRGRVRQVLLNLLSNAIKFTPDGGRITVAAATVNGGDFARIAVTDTGIGIAPDDQPKLFKEF